MTIWRSVVVYCGVLASVRGFTGTGPVSQCIANPGALPLAVRVSGCDVAPCLLQQKEYAVIDIAFRAPRDTSTLTTTVVPYVTISKVTIPVPYDLAEKSATCNYLLNSSCPVREGEILLYTLNLFIESMFPVGLNTVVEVTILDDTGAAACLRVPFKIKQPRVPRSNLIH